MLKKPLLKLRMEKNLAQIRKEDPDREGFKEQIFVDQEEKADMKKCHSACSTLLKRFFFQLKHLSRGRALEVAAGDGRVTYDVLKDLFTVINCFDINYDAVKILEGLQQKLPVIKKVDQAFMQSFVWTKKYSCVIMRWCVGYLTDEELINFLKKAYLHLMQDP